MLAQFITAAAVVVLLVALITVIIRLRLHGHNALSGRSPIPMWMLIAGKLSIATSISLMLLRALGFPIGPTASMEIQTAAVVLLLVGLGFAVPSLFQLGEELRFGLSQQQAVIKSTGLYRISRNPLYLGFYLIGFASCLYVPVVINLILVVVAIAVHHRVILAEEHFLHRQFGEAYDPYFVQVHRYL
jgi:protein-S-isoprenylcysteine O-methyltransferase Ste14